MRRIFSEHKRILSYQFHRGPFHLLHQECASQPGTRPAWNFVRYFGLGLTKTDRLRGVVLRFLLRAAHFFSETRLTLSTFPLAVSYFVASLVGHRSKFALGSSVSKQSASTCLPNRETNSWPTKIWQKARIWILVLAATLPTPALAHRLQQS